MTYESRREWTCPQLKQEMLRRSVKEQIQFYQFSESSVQVQIRMRCFKNQCQSKKKSLWKQGCLSTPPQGVHYFMLLTDDKHLVGKGANAMIGKLQRIHNFTLFAASHSPAPRQSVVDDRTPQIMDWDVGSKDFQRLACKTWKCYWVISGPVSSFAHKNSWKDGPISHFIATSTALFVLLFHLFVCCMN